MVSLGSDGFYQKEGFTYFQMSNNAWNILKNGGSRYVEAVNNQFMYNQMNQGKEFGITINPIIGIGRYTRLEYDLLSASEKFIKVFKEGFDHYFIPK